MMVRTVSELFLSDNKHTLVYTLKSLNITLADIGTLVFCSLTVMNTRTDSFTSDNQHVSAALQV